MKALTEFILKIGKVDRRWIFLVLAIVVFIPILIPIGMPIRATVTTKVVFDAIENLPPNSKVLVSLYNNGFKIADRWQGLCISRLSARERSCSKGYCQQHPQIIHC